MPPPEGSCEGRLPMFVLRLKLLLLFMYTLLLPPQPHPQHQPPPHQAPIMTPMPKEIATPAA